MQLRKLESFPLLKEKVFYRGCPILAYIQNHGSLASEDIKALKATLMDALVTSREVQLDPDRFALDFDRLAIVESGQLEDGYYHYETTPDVMGFPHVLQEAMRHKCLQVTGGLPISVFLSLPTEHHIEDMNRAMESLFSDFTEYNFTQQVAGKVKTQQLVEVRMHGELYMIDTVSKRFLKSSYFNENYEVVCNSILPKAAFSGKALRQYQQDVREVCQYASYLVMSEPLLSGLENNCIYSQFLYERKESEKNFPRAFQQAALASGNKTSLEKQNKPPVLYYTKKIG